MTWTIEAKSYPIEVLSIPTGQNHLYIEIFDDNGNRVAQYNALATNPITGQPVLAGSDADILMLYNSTDWGGVLSGTEGLTRDAYPSLYGGDVLFSGTQAQVETIIAALEAYKSFINANSDYLPYSLQFPIELDNHYNSNSGFSGMADVISAIVGMHSDWTQVDQAALSIFKQTGSNPGVNDDILRGQTWTPNFDASGNIIGSHVVGTTGTDLMNYGVGTNVLIGGNGDDLFGFGGLPNGATAPTGNNVVYGGSETNKVADDASDGTDTFLYSTNSNDATSINIKVFSDHKEVTNADNPSVKTTLYSVENVFANTFDALNHADFSSSPVGIILKDMPTDKINDPFQHLNQNMNPATTAVQVADSEYANFGTFTGTNYADTFELNQNIGRVFNGGLGADAVSYAGLGTGININLQNGTTVVHGQTSASAPVDTFNSIERYTLTAQDDAVAIDGRTGAVLESIDAGAGGNDRLSMDGVTYDASTQQVLGTDGHVIIDLHNATGFDQMSFNHSTLRPDTQTD